jgi:tetratricopeptide (TPR) repeat protein
LVLAGGPQVCLAAADAGQPGSFMLEPAGARGTALGLSYGALSDEASAIYWNPAALSILYKPEVNISRTWLFENTDHTFLSFAYPLTGTVGLAGAYILQASAGYERRVNPFDTPQTFSISNQALLLGAGIKLPFKPFPAQAGLTLKSVTHTIDKYSDSGFGADAALRAVPAANLTLAAVFHNVIRPTTELVSRSATYPYGLTLAAAYTRDFTGDLAASFSAGACQYAHALAKPSAGAELSYKKTAALRLSIDEDGLVSGVGLQSGNYIVDYAVKFHELAAVHVISLSVKFGVTMAELEEYIRKGISKFDKGSASRLAGAYMQKAEIFLKTKNYIQAIKTLETAALWDPSNQTIAEKLAAARREMDSSLNAQVMDRNVSIATQYFDRGDYVASREYWQHVLELDPENSQARLYLEKIEAQLSRKEMERLEAEKLAAARLRADALLEEAAGLLKAEKYTLAAARAKKALALVPGDKQADTIITIAQQGLSLSIQKRLARVNVLCENKLYPQALEIITTILEDDPAQKTAMEQESLCKNAMKPGISPADAKRIEKLYYMAVDAYLKNNYDAALGQLEEIFKIDPFNDPARTLSEKIKKAGRTE